MDKSEINLDELDDFDFTTLEDEDKKENFIKKRKKILKGTIEEKKIKIQLHFKEQEKEELEKFKDTLGVKTFNAIIYKFIELGKEQHKNNLLKIIGEYNNE